MRPPCRHRQEPSHASVDASIAAASLVGIGRTESSGPGGIQNGGNRKGGFSIRRCSHVTRVEWYCLRRFSFLQDHGTRALGDVGPGDTMAWRHTARAEEFPSWSTSMIAAGTRPTSTLLEVARGIGWERIQRGSGVVMTPENHSAWVGSEHPYVSSAEHGPKQTRFQQDFAVAERDRRESVGMPNNSSDEQFIGACLHAQHRWRKLSERCTGS
jgi:hypothetical protein